jgi:hypothetical protein
MVKTLSQQFGPDTVRKFERAAPQRLEEAATLVAGEHRLVAIYLYGYAIEMLLKAAYFKQILRHASTTEIDRETRMRVEARARQSGFMSREPHDFAGWARLLVTDRRDLKNDEYEKRFGQQIVDKATLAYGKWRPEMRYRVTDASEDDVKAIRSVAEWFLQKYPSM